MIVYLSAMVKYLFSVLIYGLYMERSLELQNAGFCDGSPYLVSTCRVLDIQEERLSAAISSIDLV